MISGPKKGRRTTIYDIASATNVSPTTVSLVLSGTWKKYRIKPATASGILECARRLGYAVNLNARGLRLSRSGLAGMIIPHHRNRFFAGLAEAFEEAARIRDLCPIVVSTHRNPDNELKVAEALLAQQVEFLFIAGVRDPGPLNALCLAAHTRCINVDLPGANAPSVVSDNRRGALELTNVMLDRLTKRGADPADVVFFGGVADDDATRNRLAGFVEALESRGLVPREQMIACCGYAPRNAAAYITSLHARLGRLPRGLFVNGVTALEGALRALALLPKEQSEAIVFGCFDWDPFAARLPFEVIMVRQDVEAMIAEAFALIDRPLSSSENLLILVPTRIAGAGESDGQIEDWDIDLNRKQHHADAGLISSSNNFPVPPPALRALKTSKAKSI
ncbi:MAG: LacI family DNA-binding transcriptional regulator [Devosia sp.]